MAFATYAFADILASIAGPGGAFSLGAGAGIADEGITVEYADAKGSLTPGADGTYMHSLHAANNGSVTVRMLKTSPVNKMLSDLYNFQKGSSANWGQNVITVSNHVTGDSFICNGCSFQQFPNNTNAKDGGMNEWRFLSGEVIPNLGNGAPTPPPS
jgi:hypothetical protein